MRRIKHLGDNEFEAYRLIRELHLTHVTVPYLFIKKNTILMGKGVNPPRHDINIVRLYRDLLQNLYAVHNDTFSPGVYAFLSSGKGIQSKNFLKHILAEAEDMQKRYGNSLPEKIVKVYHEASQAFHESVGQFADNFPASYSLLHGDLHAGNILQYRGKYRLIDFEHLRIGPIELELAFFLCWESVVHPGTCHILERDLQLLLKHGAISQTSFNVIAKCLIPALLVFFCLSCAAGFYRENDSIAEGCQSFWNEFRQLLLITKNS